MPTRKEPSLSVLTMVIILTATIVTLTGFGIFGNNAQGQGNLTKGNVTLTPEQVASICNPDNPKLNFVNTTESKICGIPKTVKPHLSSSNMTTGAEAPPEPPPPSTSIAPSAVPPP
ncbi:MAG: hypothetical protein ACJ71R_22140 [Nitrososphaeraceae archaeon]